MRPGRNQPSSSHVSVLLRFISTHTNMQTHATGMQCKRQCMATSSDPLPLRFMHPTRSPHAAHDVPGEGEHKIMEHIRWARREAALKAGGRGGSRRSVAENSMGYSCADCAGKQLEGIVCGCADSFMRHSHLPPFPHHLIRAALPHSLFAYPLPLNARGAPQTPLPHASSCSAPAHLPQAAPPPPPPPTPATASTAWTQTSSCSRWSPTSPTSACCAR
jgi:hypothetical protein